MATIFDAIVRKENDYTNLFRSLLERDVTFAVAALNYLLDIDITETDAARLVYRTQQRFTESDELMIPDLVIEGNELYCIVEIKTGYATETQASQERGYVSCFTGERQEYFVFLVPSDWKDTRKMAAVTMACRLKNVFARKKTWQELAKKVHEKTAEVSDLVMKEAISFLFESFEVLTVEETELSSLSTWRDSYVPLRKVERTIDQAEKIFRANGFETEKETSDLDAYGFYIKRNGKYRLWVGLWTSAPSAISYGYHLKKSEWEKPVHDVEGGAMVKNHKIWPLPDSAIANPQHVFEAISSMHKRNWEGSSNA